MITIDTYRDTLTGDLVELLSDPRGSDNTVSVKLLGGDQTTHYRCPVHRIVLDKPRYFSQGEQFIVTKWKHHYKVETFQDAPTPMMSRIWVSDGGFLNAGWTTLAITLPVLGSYKRFNIASSPEGSFVNFLELL